MTSTTASSLLPHAVDGNRAGVVLALLAHAGLVVALALATQWRTQSPTEVSAELWAAVPQSAAPPQQATPQAAPAAKPEPVVPAAKTPVAQPPAQANRDAEIAVEKAKAVIERKALEAAALKKSQAEAEAQKKRDDDKAKAAAAAAKQDDERLAKQREDNLRRMLGQAGSTVSTNPSPTSSGTATASAAPSASYAGRVVAHVRPLIVLTAQVNGNPSAEVEVRTAAGGSIISRRLLKTSGQSEWDEAVLRALDRAGSLPRDADGRVPPVLTLVFRPLD